jgi:AcrR family transcriptional regulator
VDTNKQKNRNRVLNIARSLINEKGYEEATIRGIGKMVGLAPASVLETFPSKRDLFYEVIRGIEEPVYAEVERIFRSQNMNPQEKVAAALKAHFLAHKHELRLVCEIIAYAFTWDAKTEARDQRRHAPLLTALFEAVGLTENDQQSSARVESLIGPYILLLRRARLAELQESEVERGIESLAASWWESLGVAAGAKS